MVRLAPIASLTDEILAAIVAAPYAWCSLVELVAALPGRHPASVRRAVAAMLEAGELVAWDIPGDRVRRVTLSARTAEAHHLELVESGPDERPHWWDLTRLDDPPAPKQPKDPLGDLFPAWLAALVPPEVPRQPEPIVPPPPEPVRPLELWGRVALPWKPRPPRGRRRRAALQVPWLAAM